jgi:hypothetical protein
MAANFPVPAAPGEQWTDPGTGITWEWDGDKWVAAGGIVGGGVAGPPGPSAYEVAVVNGFVGTEAEWLASLEGADGPAAVSADAGNASRLGTDSLIYTPQAAAEAPLLSDGSTVSIDLTTAAAATALADEDLVLVQQGTDKRSATLAAVGAKVLCGYIVKGDLPPDPATDPCVEEGMIWVDTSTEPPTINVWDPGANGGAGGWVDGGTGGGGGTGPGVANPLPGQTTAVPPFEGGTGTIDSPYILTAATAFAGGKVSSAQTITFQGQPVGSLVSWVDNNSATNGGRYNQPIGTVNSSGLWSGKLGFYDVPATASKSYVGLLVCGGVYFSWGVTTQSQGVETPSILEVLGTDGNFYSAPTEPSYLTASSVGSVYSATGITGLTASAESTELTPAGGSGSGLTVKATTDDTGALSLVSVVNGGIGYVYDEEVTINLSSIGGATSQAMKIRTHPVTTASPTFKVSPFTGINAGAFASSEWQISTSPAFLSPTTFTTTTDAETISVGTGQPQNTEYYVRFRYTSGGGVMSEYSPAVRCATGALRALKYILGSFKGASFGGQSFDSGLFYVTPKPYLYLVLIDNPEGTATGPTAMGLDNGAYRWSNGGPVGDAMPPGRFAAFLQLRQPIKFRVTSLAASNGVAAVEKINTAYGINDWHANGNPATVTGGSGSGCSLILGRNSTTGETTYAALSTPGSGYSLGDELTFTPPLGNGGNRSDYYMYGSPRTTNVTGFSVGTMDSYWDFLIHGIGNTGGSDNYGGTPGQGAGYLLGPGQAGSPVRGGRGGAAGTPRSAVYCTAENSGQTGAGPACGAGGTGFGGGGGGGGGADGSDSGGGGGGATWLNTTLVSKGQLTPTTYPDETVEVYFDGQYKESFKHDLKYYRLA